MTEHALSHGARRTAHALTSDLAACVWIPHFPLRAEERRRPELTGQPVALLSPTNTRRVWMVSSLARRAGVRAGITVSQAIGLCPSLTLCEPDPVYYDERFTQLLLALESVSPVIEPSELGRAFVGVDGLGRLVGGPERQLAAVANALNDDPHRPTPSVPGVGRRAAGYVAPPPAHRSPLTAHPGGPEPRGWTAWLRLGWGRGKFLSWVAATRAKSGESLVVTDEERVAFLASQPVAVLPIAPETHRRLRQLGLHTLADVERLPEVAMVSQFGREGRRAWRLAAGHECDAVTSRERPEPIVVGMDFPAPVADRDMLVHALERLIARGLAHPLRTGWRVRVARARAALEHGASWLTEVVLKDPTAEPRRIVAPFEARLEAAPPAGAVERLTVEFTAFARGTDELQLFARDATSAARAGRRWALRTAAREIETRFHRRLLSHIVEVQPWSRIPERRYALIDFEP